VAVSNPYKEWGRYEGIRIELTDEVICGLFIGTVAVAEILRH